MNRPIHFLVALLVATHSVRANAEINWWFDIAGSSASITQGIIDQITTSMNVAVDRYNVHSDYEWNQFAPSSAGIRVVYYQSVPTANASYKGRIAFGGSRSEHTALHEMSHVLGVGTHGGWNWASNRDSANNKWLGEHALNELREINNDPAAVLNADSIHFWPYGLNGNDGDRTAHVKMVGALREDMNLTNGNYVEPDLPVIARYTFDNDLSSSDAHLQSTASDFVLGSKILHSTISSTLRAEGNDPLNETFADAASNGFTADFTVTSATGVDLDRMTFIAQFNYLDAGETGGIVLRSSADGFTSDLANVSNADSVGGALEFVEVDLTSFTDVTNETFRFYFLGENDSVAERTRIESSITLYGLPETGPGIEGDFNSDGNVDGADLAIWESEYGTARDSSDFFSWQRNYSPPFSGQLISPVPEPATLQLIVAMASALVVRRRRRRLL